MAILSTALWWSCILPQIGVCAVQLSTERDVVRHGGTNAKMTVSTENSHFLVNYSPSD